MIYMCIRYRVSDFLIWHKGFMKNESLRISAGVKVENILRNTNDKNSLTILYAIDSIPESKDFIEKATTEEMLNNLGIESKVSVEYFDVFY